MTGTLTSDKAEFTVIWHTPEIFKDDELVRRTITSPVFGTGLAFKIELYIGTSSEPEHAENILCYLMIMQAVSTPIYHLEYHMAFYIDGNFFSDIRVGFPRNWTSLSRGEGRGIRFVSLDELAQYFRTVRPTTTCLRIELRVTHRARPEAQRDELGSKHADMLLSTFDRTDLSDVTFRFPADGDGRSIYALKRVLSQADDYFRDMFTSGFQEGENNHAGATPSASVSDMFEDDSDADDDDVSRGVSMHETAPSPAEREEVGQGNTLLEDSGDTQGQATIDDRCDIQERPSKRQRVETKESDANGEAVRTQADQDSQKTFLHIEQSLESGTVDSPTRTVSDAGEKSRSEVVILDFTYRTYYAFLLYLITASISFSPLRSSFNASKKRAKKANAEHIAWEDYREYHATRLLLSSSIPFAPASPKSIYRLADKLRVPKLMDLARRQIMASLTVRNALAEASSAFSEVFDDIRKEQIEFIRIHWDKILKQKNTFSTLSEKRAAKLLQELLSTSTFKTI